MLSNATDQIKFTAEFGYMCSRGLTGPPAVTLTKWAILKICPNSKDSYFGKVTHNIFA